MANRLLSVSAVLLLGPLCLLLPAAPVQAAEALGGVQLDEPPFLLTTDVGNSTEEETKYGEWFLKNMLRTKEYFLQVYNLKDTCFQDYADFWAGNKFESRIRVNIWKKYSDFLADYQKRY